MKYEFSYNGKVISYEIIHKKVKNINIRVCPTGEVYVSCNDDIDNKIIELEMIKRANWLLNSIEKYKTNLIEFSDTKLKLVDGESFLLFGKILRIKNIDSQQFNVEYDNNYLYLYRDTKKGVKIKFNKWYKEFVKKSFEELIETAYQKFEKYDIKKPEVIIKNMKTQWGSCNTNKKIITLNTQLAKVDPFLIEYVICHELTHLIYKNHNTNFYTFLTTMVPDWKQREKILNNIFINQLGGL